MTLINNTKLTKNQLGPKVINFLLKTHVKLIILDEFQHLLSNSTSNKVDNVANWIKYLINQTRIPLVIMGMPEATSILTENSQLDRRVYTRYRLSFFSLESENSINIYHDFLLNLSKEISFQNSSILFSKFYGLAFFYLASKSLALLMRIVRFACRVAIYRSRNYLEHDDFVNALVELHHYQHIMYMIKKFTRKDYEAFKTEIQRNQPVNWEYFDEIFSP